MLGNFSFFDAVKLRKMHFLFFNILLTWLFQGCQPYSIAPCGREGEPKCSKDEADTPKCKAYCTNPKYGAPYRSESYHGKIYHFLCASEGKTEQNLHIGEL